MPTSVLVVLMVSSGSGYTISDIANLAALSFAGIYTIGLVILIRRRGYRRRYGFASATVDVLLIAASTYLSRYAGESSVASLVSTSSFVVFYALMIVVMANEGAFWVTRRAPNGLIMRNDLFNEAVKAVMLALTGFIGYATAHRFDRAFVEQQSLTDSFARFVPREFLEYLGKRSIVQIELGDQTIQDMTILFADIRSFTTLSESMSPQENFRFLNSYRSHIGPIVRQAGGFIDKYVGDAIMALFPDPPERALEASIAMQRALAVYNGYRANSGYQPVRIGIGLHRGTMTLGTIGEKGRMDTSVIPDAVNIASRLESMTKRYGAHILVSGALIDTLSNHEAFDARAIDSTRVKGKRKKIAIFEILETLDEADSSRRRMNSPLLAETALLIKRGCWSDALKRLETASVPDPAVSFFRLRCERAMRAPDRPE
ncbi:MAG: adenylate/guanylate cyclase domain-containing protein [Rectinemataceae bacterium]